MYLCEVFKEMNFKMFESRSDVDAICKKYDIREYTINDDMSISVDGDVDLSCSIRKPSKIPLKFKEVSGYFDCSYNQLSLEGCPERVGGSFYCGFNNLESLEGCPKIIGGDFYCSNNDTLAILNLLTILKSSMLYKAIKSSRIDLKRSMFIWV